MSTRTRRRTAAPDPFDAEVRAMLQRRAADVRPSPDARRRLAARLADEEGIVVHLHRPPAAEGRRRARVLSVVALLLVSMVAAAAWVTRSGSGGTETSRDPQAAGSDDGPPPFFDPATADPVYSHPADGPPVTVDQVVDEYLDLRLGNDRELMREPARITGDGLATARWATHADGATYSGTIHLRSIDGRWAVVGTACDQLEITEAQVRPYPGEIVGGQGPRRSEVSITLTTHGTPGPGHGLLFEVSDGKHVRGGVKGPEFPEVWREADGFREHLPYVDATFQVPIDPRLPQGTPVILTVHHVDEQDTPLSLTEFWVEDPAGR
ncbi:MAG: hypothetical protein ACLFXM_04570 [Acidimicrobiia bacterium]